MSWFSGLFSSRCEAEAPAPAPAESSDADLRRFETVPTAEVDTTAQLVKTITHLRAVLDERANLDNEALRVQRAVQKQEEADSVKLMGLLREREAEYAEQLAAAKGEVEARLVVRMREEERLLAKQRDERLVELDEHHAAELAAADAATTAAATEYYGRHAQAAEFAATKQLGDDLLAGRRAHAAELAKLELETAALGGVLSHDSQYRAASHAVRQLAGIVLQLDGASLGGARGGAAAGWKALGAVSERLGDPLLREAVGASAERTSGARVPTVAQLSERFGDVSHALRRAALTPAGSGLWGHAVAGVTAKLAVPTGRIPEAAGAAADEWSATAAVVVDVEESLARGALADAVRAARRLEPAQRAVASGWLAAAEERLLLEQTLAVARAQSAVALAALA